MKKFNFELEDVLNFRKIQQQQAESELAAALAAERQFQAQIDELALKKVQLEKSVEGSKDFNAISNASQYFSFVREKVDELLSEIAKAKLVSDEKREALRLCMKKTSSLEKLKESQKQEFIAEQKKIEAKQIDDIVTSHFR